MSPYEGYGDDWPEYPDFPEESEDHGSGGSGSRSGYDIRLSYGATILEGTLGPVYGTRVVPAYCMFKYERSTANLMMGFAYCVGESVGVAEQTINEEPVEGSDMIQRLRYNSYASWPPDYRWSETLLGKLDADNRSYMIENWGPDECDERYPGIVYDMIYFKRSKMQSGTIAVEGLVGGKIIEDFRPGGGAPTNYDNPALIAYDICRSLETWKGLEVTEIDTDHLAEIADWCDEDINGFPRYHFNARLDIRDTDEALQEVLRHCFTKPYVYNQKMYFIADKPPSPISGIWNIDEGQNELHGSESSGCHADTELVPGDIVTFYDGGSHFAYTVLQVNNYKWVIVEEVATHTSSFLPLFKISNVHFRKNEYVKKPSGVDKDFAQAPDVVSVKFETTQNDPRDCRCEDPDGYPHGDPREREVTLMGCISMGMAYRWGHQERRGIGFRPFSWQMTVGPEGATLAPGDVFLFDTDDGLTNQLARCVGKKEGIEAGTYEIRADEFDMGVYSDEDADDDSPPDGLDPIIPVIGVNHKQYLIEQGNWDANSLIANPDDWTSWGVNLSPDVAIAYDGVLDETDFTLTGGPHTEWQEVKFDMTPYIANHCAWIFSFLIKGKQDHTRNRACKMAYYAGNNASTMKFIEDRYLGPYAGYGEDQYFRITWRLWTRPAYNRHEIRFRFGTSENIDANPCIWAFKRMRLFGWGRKGDPLWPQIPTSSPLYNLQLAERFEWDPGVEADLKNEKYQLIRGRGWGFQDIVMVDLGINDNQVAQTVMGPGAQFQPNIETLNQHAGSDLLQGFFIHAVSPTNHTRMFGDPEQFFEGDVPPVSAHHDRSVVNWMYQIQNPAIVYRFRSFKESVNYSFDIPQSLWNDYEIELWLDQSGGTNYVLAGVCDVDKQIAYGHGNVEDVRTHAKWADIQTWVPVPFADVAGARYQLWLHSKYTGLRTRMPRAATTWDFTTPPLPGQPQNVEFVHEIYEWIEWIQGVPTQFRNERTVFRWTDSIGTDLIGRFRFVTRRNVGLDSTEYATDVLVNTDPYDQTPGRTREASWSETISATFPNELPIPTLHNEGQVVAKGLYHNKSASSAFVPLVEMYAQGWNPQQQPPIYVPPDKPHVPEPVTITTEGGALLDGGDEFVVKKNFTIPARIDQPFDMVYDNDGDIVMA